MIWQVENVYLKIKGFAGYGDRTQAIGWRSHKTSTLRLCQSATLKSEVFGTEVYRRLSTGQKKLVFCLTFYT